MPEDQLYSAYPLLPYITVSIMEGMDKFNHLHLLADQLIPETSKDDLAEVARMLAMKLAHYEIKYGSLPLDVLMLHFNADKPNDAQAKMLAKGMENLVGLLENIRSGQVFTDDQMH